MDYNNLAINYYKIFLQIDINRLKYRGNVLISFNLINTNLNKIEINSSNFNIKSIKINNLKCKWNHKLNEDLILLSDNFISNTEYLIEIVFDWKKITNEPDGFYYAKKNDKIILLTNLEPISARKFIPCFDFPDLKAKFDIVIKINNNKINCISNMGLKKKIVSNSDIIYFFNTTPPMSTYLLCIVCGNIDCNINNQVKTTSGIKINGYSVTEDLKYIKWSIEKTAEALDFFESWFGIKYPLDKLDIVSIPNFSSGAMENWGLITFREEAILMYNKNKTIEQIKILEVIYHEVAHQWFGNLVTLRKWNDLWLNEATATFFSWMALLKNYPEYNIQELYWLLENKNVYIIDGFENTHSIILNSNNNMQLNPVELFDEITYSKGNLIINYMANLLNLNNFKKSIKKYLNMYLYSNPLNGNELFEYFNECSTNKNIDYIEIMEKLIKTKGYPILFINKINNNEFSIVYKKFNLDKNIFLDYPIDLFIKIKYKDEEIILNLKYNQTNYFKIKCDISKCVINPNNELFCIVKYINFKPCVQIFNQVELMNYIYNKYIFGLYGHEDLNNYLKCVEEIFNSIDFNENNILCASIINDLIHLLTICELSNVSQIKIIRKIKNNLDNKLSIVVEELLFGNVKYSEYILENILNLKAIKLEDTNYIKIVWKIYQIHNDLTHKSTNYYNKYYLSKIMFSVVMKYYQDTEFDNLKNILKNSQNANITSNIISSFSYLNDNNFEKIFSNYIHMIKSQDLALFFNSISKIKSKQNFLIDYWIKSRDKISSLEEINFKILKSISKNIFNFELKKKITDYLEENYFLNDSIIVNNIKDILKTNIIICNNLTNLSKKYLI